MATLFKLWRKSADSRPYLTIFCTELVLASCGDILAQTADAFGLFDSKNSKKAKNTDPDTSNPRGWYDINRTVRFAFCAAMISPLGVRWHSYIDKRFPLIKLPKIKNQSRKRRSIKDYAMVGTPLAKRVFCDQLMFEPIVYLSLFTGLGLSEGLDIFQVKQKLTDVAFPAYLTALTLYPFIQAVNFSVIPLVYRVPFSSSFDIFWDTYLSWANSNSIPKN
ncbi:hypothetical protein BB561_001533 [Smittium simulii]|uniref:Uncharacterized protein n=1 Tax=Smittium simulii TaxID=133385 RepID=A0A2T9YU59_9FUNG|nr:hypothetical protein BB561_001533 [Smittium simulii]